jgi:ABC-type nickel/cobalt efflux system permease component RcnA
MQTIVYRLIEVFIAMLLAGLVLLVFNGVTANQWPMSMIFIVPVGFMWSFVLGAMAAADISRGLFLLVGAVAIAAVYFIARYVKRPALRVGGETAVFVAQQAALVYLFAAQGLMDTA